MQRRGRRHLARLDDAGAARRERERQLLRDDQQREIPWRDDRDDADRLAQHEAEPVRAQRGVALAVQRARQRGGIAPDVGGALDLADRLRDRLARFQAVEMGEEIAVAVDRVGDPEQHARALARGHSRPGALVERRARRGDGPFRVRRAAARRARHQRAMSRAVALERLAMPASSSRPSIHIARSRGKRASAASSRPSSSRIGERAFTSVSFSCCETSARAWRETPPRLRPDPASSR